MKVDRTRLEPLALGSCPAFFFECFEASPAMLNAPGNQSVVGARRGEHSTTDERNGSMAKAKTGDTVLVHYTGTLEDGSVFDSSEERSPLEFQLGDRNIIPGFQDAVVGMEPGDTKKTEVSPEQAYGPRRMDMVLEFDRSEVPASMNPEPGHQLELRTDGGQSVPARIVDVDDAKITVDANHPLAGETLNFEIRLMEIR